MPGALDDMAALLRGRRVTALTGAGVSTESGIPDYRGPETRRRARNPVQYRAFITSEEARRRYWARALVGWSRFSKALPNPGHEALAALERGGQLTGLITQNVDRLHHAAGSQRVVELHGALEDVRCLSCDDTFARHEHQARLREFNPTWVERRAPLAPDGDADVEDQDGAISSFHIPPCPACGGVLKPDVVFFGENCRREVVDAAWELFDEGEVLLIVGSSLAIFSGYRFLRRAQQREMPIGIINLGPARGDEHAAVRVELKSGEALPRLAALLAQPA